MTKANELRMLNARVSILKELEGNLFTKWSPALVRHIVKHLPEPVDKEERIFPDDKTRDVMFLTARVFGVPVSTLGKRTRLRSVNDARQVAMYLMYKTTGKTVSTIGKMFNRDHSTVIHARRKVSDVIGMGIEKDYISKIRKIEELIA